MKYPLFLIFSLLLTSAFPQKITTIPIESKYFALVLQTYKDDRLVTIYFGNILSISVEY